MHLKWKILIWNIFLVVLILITTWIIDYNLDLWDFHFLVFYLWSLYAFVILILMNLIISIIFYIKKDNRKWWIFIKYWLSVDIISLILLLISNSIFN